MSEFFGHVKGSFGGAVRDRIGRFQLADGGTLFLDEIREIPLNLQGKLLRVLQEGSFERVGDERTRQGDVRVIAATNRDLKEAVAPVVQPAARDCRGLYGMAKSSTNNRPVSRSVSSGKRTPPTFPRQGFFATAAVRAK